MPHTGMAARYLNRTNPALLIGTSLGWGSLGSVRKDDENNVRHNSIYTSKSLNLNNSSDFKQHLLEIRLNDLALKFCAQYGMVSPDIAVVRKTAARNPAPDEAEDGLRADFPQSSLLFQKNGVVRTEVFVYEALPSGTSGSQEILNKKLNNTVKIEAALKTSLWQHILLEKLRQKGITAPDLGNLTLIDTLNVYDALERSVLEQKFLEQRKLYVRTRDLNAIDDRFLFYKRACRDKVIQPAAETADSDEIRFIADGIQELRNSLKPEADLEKKIRFIRSIRSGFIRNSFSSAADYSQKLKDIYKICGEHIIGGKSVNFDNFRSTESRISSQTIALLRDCPEIPFRREDEDAINGFIYQDGKKELQQTVSSVKDAFVRFYKNKEYLKR